MPHLPCPTGCKTWTLIYSPEWASLKKCPADGARTVLVSSANCAKASSSTLHEWGMLRKVEHVSFVGSFWRISAIFLFNSGELMSAFQIGCYWNFAHQSFPHTTVRLPHISARSPLDFRSMSIRISLMSVSVCFCAMSAHPPLSI